MLLAASSHGGNFTHGQNGATYSVVVSNATGAGPTSGKVTVTEAIPGGLTLVSMNGGTTWDCTAPPTCTTSTMLAGGQNYPAITVTVNVANGAAASVTNQVSVSGGGSGGNSAGDVTIIGLESQTISFGTLGSLPFGSATFSVSATSSSGLTVSFASTTPLTCSISNNTTVTLLATGKCTIEATQAGNTNYSAATPVDQSFQVFDTCDIGHKGITTVADVQSMIDEALGSSPAINDLNGDGIINIADAQIVINDAVGLGCAFRSTRSGLSIRGTNR